MPERPQPRRDVLPVPDINPCRADDVRREGSGDVVPADRAAAAARGRAERARDPARRRRLRRVERLRRARSRRRIAERLAANGLKYNRFHTTALCSPTRQALLTGRNHHAVGMGGITEIATSAPGYNSIRPNTCAPLAETLKLNGYSTAQFGKCHEVPVWETSPMGPFNAWPTGSGFEHFYGFIGGETNQYAPAIYQRHGADRAAQDGRGGLSLHRGHDRRGDRLDQAAEGADAGQAVLHLLRARRDARAPSRADGVVGQVQGAVRRRLGRPARADARPSEGARRHPGRCGADRAPGGDPRLGRHARRPEAGARAADGGLRGLPRAHRPPRRPADRLVARARGPREHARLLHHRRQRRLGRGHAERVLQRARRPERRAGLETTEFMVSKIDDFGTPAAYNHYAVGWAHAMDTPYQWTKQIASHWGGTRNGTIVHWPSGIKAGARSGRSSTT